MSSRLIGKTVDNYHILEELGSGGMGTVYKAIDRSLEKYVALKVMDPRLSHSDNFMKRFRAEAKALAKLEDPNIVRVFALRDTDYGLFMVMEYVPGTTLDEMIKKDGPLPVDKALSVFRQLVNAISHAHRVGVIHRDIKPSNVMITSEGVVKVMDFGLAKMQRSLESTVTMAAGGTLHYMSPEHMRGLDKVDHRSDVYSLGMTFYEALTGRTPFQRMSEDFAIRKTIVEGSIQSPDRHNPNIPKYLAGLVMRALEKDARKRFQSAEEMLKALTRFERSRQPWWRLVLSLAAGLAILLLVLLIVFVLIPVAKQVMPRFEGTKKANLLISSEPANAAVFLGKDSVGATPLRISFNKSKVVLLRLSKKDYFPRDTLIVVTRNRAPKVFIALRAEARVSIEARPVTAQILLNGKTVEGSRLRALVLPAGEHRICVSAPGYESLEKSFRLRQGRNPIIKFSLQPKRSGQAASMTALRTASSPSRTTKTHVDSRMPPNGPVSSSVAKIGNRNLPTGRTKKSAVATGVLRIHVNPKGALYVDGKLMKRNVDKIYSAVLPVGRHHVKIGSHQSTIWEKLMVVKANQTQEVFVDFNKEAKLSVAAFDAKGKAVRGEIYVDKKFIQKYTPAELKLRPGLHTIEVRRPGYLLVGGARSINVVSDLKLPLKFTLKQVR
jgi:serine/threonine protein kinase